MEFAGGYHGLMWWSLVNRRGSTDGKTVLVTGVSVGGGENEKDLRASVAST